ncbi:MAG: carboxyltransferase domain-containing protein [Galactobacter sp.]|uniref:5-oxoprolinase subunit B/C family protein n=1 Tax=Galactobacter sp. TaxID=2676125 RepID=UPI0025C4584C|nr:urea amidolyase family protein [Galactobacter sp.]
MSPRFLPFGDTAVLVDLSADQDPLESALAWHADLSLTPLPGQVEVLAAAETVLVRFWDARAASASLAALPLRVPDGGASRRGRVVTIDTVYSGEDLHTVASLTGMSPEAVVGAHEGSDWTVAFGGFAPGFSYLTGGDSRLEVPRRDSPRTAVPAGAVALAGAFSAVYPRVSPGGWQLIGHAETRMWDLSRDQPALLQPGDTVRFTAVREHAVVTESEPTVSVSADSVEGTPALTVISPGLFTSVQDGGRPGFGDQGVTRSGAADRPSSAQANRLVGLPEDGPVLETLLGGLTLRAETATVVALTGAVGEATISGHQGSRPAPARAPFALYPGETLALGAPTAGLRGYVGVRVTEPDAPGGALPLRVHAELGSASTDTLSGLGTAALEAGDVLHAVASRRADGASRPRAVGHPESPATALPIPGKPVTLRVTSGPRSDWFEGGAESLTGIEWGVSSKLDRVGVRLQTAGEALQRIWTRELASEGMVPGAVQVPPDGNPVVFLADHPVTGGYPVIATVIDADLPLAAQIPPGTPVRFELQNPRRDS